jgi:hypothetical protein
MPPYLEQWQYPIGRYQTKEVFLAEEINTSIEILKVFPSALKDFYQNAAQRTLINLIAQEGWPSNNLFPI